jgi:light-regulated signal transduction histidine kinase (bacteriophytochrome)
MTTMEKENREVFGRFELEKIQTDLMNLFESYRQEKENMEDTQKAILNILDDNNEDKLFLQNSQRAVLNILDDYSDEKKLSDDTQKAVLNILEDYSDEKKLSDDTQKAVINILEDYSIEKANVEKMNIKLTSSNKEIEQFAYVASHDLQEPLRTISNFVNLFQTQYKGALDKDADEYLNLIIGATSRMQLLIKDLLDYSRIGSDKNKVAVDCNTLLKEVLNDMAKSIQDSKAEIHFEPLPIINGFLSGLKSLFQNLITNAIKYRKSDTQTIINITAQDKNNEWLFAIKDNGIGIDKIYYERIFIIFQKLHTQQQYAGTGIGLAQAKKIIELHGGRIWIESELGKGSTFYFTIPKTTNL